MCFGSITLACGCRLTFSGSHLPLRLFVFCRQGHRG
jgi:hypothetical protein